MDTSSTIRVKTLKVLIKEAGFSQKSFAQALGLAVSTVQYYIAGEKRPTVDVVAKMCRILKRSPKEVFESLGIDISGIPDDTPPVDNN